MPFCPICGSEYELGIEVCPDDGAGLVPALAVEPFEPEDQVDFAEAFITRSAIEAGMIQGILEDQGIDAVLSNEVAARMMPFTPPCLDIRVLVKRKDLAATRAMIEEWQEREEDPSATDLPPGNGEIVPSPREAAGSLREFGVPVLIATVVCVAIIAGPFLGSDIFFNVLDDHPIPMIIGVLIGTAIMVTTLLKVLGHLQKNELIQGENRKWWAYGMVTVLPIFLPIYFLLHIRPLKKPNVPAFKTNRT